MWCASSERLVLDSWNNSDYISPAAVAVGLENPLGRFAVHVEERFDHRHRACSIQK